MGKAFYYVARAIVKPLIWLLYGVNIKGKENLQYTGRMLIASNHTSMVDTLLIGCADRHQVHFMAKKELFSNKLGTWFFKSLGTFPVDRGKGDIAAVTAAGKILQENQTLVIFPEGTRNKERQWQLAEFQNGAALIALRNDAPILPVCIVEKPRLFHRTKVVIGEAICLADWTDDTLSRSENIRRISTRLRDTILNLRATANDRERPS